MTQKYKNYIYFLALFFVHTMSKQTTYIPRALNPIPSHLAGEVKVKDKGATQKYLNKDDFGRDIIEIAYPDGHVIWDYFDSSGRVSSLNRNSKNPQEVECVALVDKSGNIKHYHPDIIDEMRTFLRADCFVTESTREQTNNSWQQQPRDSYADNQNLDDDNHETPTESPSFLPDKNNGWFSTHMLVGYGFTSAIVLWAYYLIYQVGIGARYLYREDLWSTWKSEESYDVLLMMKPEYLADELIEAIQVKYYEEPNQIALFFRDIEEEYDTILQWMQFRNMVLSLKLSVGPDFYTLEKRLKLLDIMRKAVNYWRAEELSQKKKGL